MILNLVLAVVLMLGAVFGIVNERSMARRNNRAPRTWVMVLEYIVIAGGVIVVVLALLDLTQPG